MQVCVGAAGSLLQLQGTAGGGTSIYVHAVRVLDSQEVAQKFLSSIAPRHVPAVHRLHKGAGPDFTEVHLDSSSSHHVHACTCAYA